MIFATYQCIDYKTWKNKRYADLKKFYGIPEDKNIYWCIPANNIYQFMMYTYTCCPNQPYYLVMFETDDYYEVDGIKNDYNVEKELYNKEEYIKDLKNIVYPYKEYIVTDIPENRIEVPVLTDKFIDWINNIKYDNEEYIYKVRDFLNSYINDKDIIGVAKALFDLENNPPDPRIDINIFILRLSHQLFNLVYAIPAYYICMDKLGYNLAKEEIIVNNPARRDEALNLIHITQAHPYDSMDILYKHYLKGCYEVYKFFFVAPSIYNQKIYPNDPCPCGSGKKYKKCCINKKDIETTDIMDTVEEMIKLDKVSYNKK